MRARIFIDGGYLNNLTRGKRTDKSDRIQLDYGLFRDWIVDGIGQPELVDVFYYNAPPAPPNPQLPGHIRLKRQQFHDSRVSWYETLGEKLNFTVRLGLTKPHRCKGNRTTRHPDGTETMGSCDYVHYGQKRVDTLLVTDVAKSLFLEPEIDTYCIVSGDEDFVPAVDLIHERGKQPVMLYLPEDSANRCYWPNTYWTSIQFTISDLKSLQLKDE